MTDSTPTAIVRAVDADATDDVDNYSIDNAPMDNHVPYMSLKEQLAELTRTVEALRIQQENIAGMLAGLMEQVEPTLNQISSNPLFRSMFGGK